MLGKVGVGQGYSTVRSAGGEKPVSNISLGHDNLSFGKARSLVVAGHLEHRANILSNKDGYRVNKQPSLRNRAGLQQKKLEHLLQKLKKFI